MSKMSQLHAELSEQASELGFESLGEAEQAGYGVDWEKAKLIEPQEMAHEAWIKEKEHKLETLRLTAELCRNSDMPNIASDLENIAEFFRWCHE